MDKKSKHSLSKIETEMIASKIYEESPKRMMTTNENDLLMHPSKQKNTTILSMLRNHFDK